MEKINLLPYIAKLGLLLGQPTTYIILTTLGLMTKKYRTIFARTIFIVTFTMIYNVWLKSIWKIPLNPLLEGWAFPSGHMHAAVAFWGWLAIESRRIGLASIAIFILCLVGYGIVYYGYHTPLDIMGAVGFGSVSLFIYWLISKQPYFAEKPYRLGFLLILLSSIVMLIPTYTLKPHVWQAYAVLVSFTLGWAFYPRIRPYFKSLALPVEREPL